MNVTVPVALAVSPLTVATSVSAVPGKVPPALACVLMEGCFFWISEVSLASLHFPVVLAHWVVSADTNEAIQR